LRVVIDDENIFLPFFRHCMEQVCTMIQDFLIENLPVVDLISDVYLLVTIWGWTNTEAPSSLEECSFERALW